MTRRRTASRPPASRLSRAVPRVRTDFPFTDPRTGRVKSALKWNDPDGWVSDYGPPWLGRGQSGLSFGSLSGYGGTAHPNAWVGHDGFDGTPIGPHGPGNSVFGYGRAGGYPYRGGFLPGGCDDDDGSWLLPAITRCTEVIVEPIIRTWWRLDRKPGAAANTVEAAELPLWLRDPQLLGRVPGPVASMVPAGFRMGGHSFWSTVLTHAIWWGRGAVLFEEDAAGQPQAGTFRILNPFRVSVNRDPELGPLGRWLIHTGEDDPVVTDYDGRVPGTGMRVMVVRGLPPHDGLIPSGVLIRGFDTLRIGAQIDGYVAGTFDSGIPSGFLKVSQPNFNSQAADALRDRWMQQHRGPRREVAVLNATVEFQPIALKPVDAEVGAVKQLNLVDVAHAFGLSASHLDTSNSSNTYANLVDKNRDLVNTNLAGWAQQVMDVLTALLPYGQASSVDWTEFQQESFSQMVPQVVAAVDAGLITKNEGRERLGYPRVSDSDSDETSTPPPPAVAPESAINIPDTPAELTESAA